MKGIKVNKKDPGYKRHIDEVNMLIKFDDPRILKVKDVFEDPEEYIYTTYADLSILSHFGDQDFDEEYITNCWYLLKALVHVHDKGFTHAFLTRVNDLLVTGSFKEN